MRSKHENIESNNAFNSSTERLNKKKVSAIYHTLECLLAENSTFAEKHKPIKSENDEHDAFYINLDLAPSKNTFEKMGFICKERHLTIERFYRLPSHQSANPIGFNLPHYTEVHTHNSSDEKIVAHVYFDHDGNHVVTHTKQYQNDRNENKYEKLPLDENELKIISENIKSALTPLFNLIYEAQNRYFRFSKRAQDIESELQKISLNINSKSAKKYIELAEQFIQMVEKSNTFSDSLFDPRAKYMKEVIDKLTPPLPDEPMVTDDEDLTQPFSRTNERTHPKQKSPVEFYFNDLLKLKLRFDHLNKNCSNLENVESFIDRDKTSFDILVLLVQISPHLENLKKNQKKLIRTISEDINKVKNLLDHFIDIFWNGSPAATKKLYPAILHKLHPLYLFEKILSPIILEGINANKQTDIKQKMDILFEQSPSYHLILHSIGTIMFTLQDHSGALASPLIVAAIKNNFFAFSFLLEHGMNVNQPAVIINKTIVPILYWLTPIVNHHKDMRYVDLALKNGARISDKPQSVDSHSFMFINPNSGNTFKLTSSKNGSVRENDFSPMIASRCISEVCCAYKSLLTLEFFLPSLEIDDILFSISRLVSDGINISVIPTNPEERGCTFLKDGESFGSIVNELQSLDHLYPNFRVLILEKNGRLTDTLLTLKKLASELTKKFSTLSDKELENLYDRRFSGIRDKFYANYDRGLKTSYLTSCLIPLTYISQHSFMTHQKLIQTFCHLGAHLNKDIDSKALAVGSYATAIQIGEISVYRNELLESDLFKHAQKKVAELSMIHATPLRPNI